MKTDEIDMSPDAITGRLKMMGQLWELGVSLSKATPAENGESEKKESASETESGAPLKHL